MDCSLSYNTLSFSRLQFLPFAVKTTSSSLSSSCSRLGFSFGNYGLGFSFSVRSNRRRALVVVAASSGSQCGEYSGLNTPLEPRSAAGLFLTSVLLDDREYFLDVAKKQLEQLADDRSEAVARMNLSFGSDEAFLHSANSLGMAWMVEDY